MADINLLQKGDLATSDFSNDDTNNKGGIKVKLSPDGGNLLQKRNNGLYYGIEAPPDTRDLYVSSSTGSDSNKGTRAEPLQTIKEAFDRNNTGTVFNLYLFEDDIHEVRSSQRDFATDKGVNAQPYGPTTDSVFLRNPKGSWNRWRAKEAKRPTIKLIADGSVTIGSTQYENVLMTASNPAAVSHRYSTVNFDTTEAADLPTNPNYLGLFRSSANYPIYVSFIGCDFTLGNSFYLFNATGPAEVTFDSSVVNSQGGMKLMNLSAEASMVLRLINLRTGDVVDPSPPAGQAPLTIRATTQATEFSSLIKGYSAGSTVRYNLQTNVDLE